MGLENMPTSSDSETYLSRHEKNIEKKREAFARETEEKSKALSISPEEYTDAYARNEKNDRERMSERSSKTVKRMFEIGNIVGEEKNIGLHDRTELQYKSDELERQKELADHDSLTGLLSRRAFEEEVAKRQAVIQRLENSEEYAGTDHRKDRRKEKPPYYSLLFIDADHFKSVNDTYGHSVGDKVLQEIARTLQEKLRAKDTINTLIARWGGEEIVAIVQADIDTTCSIAERIREAIEEKVFEEMPKRKVTVSIGVAPYNKDLAHHIKTADMAVYAAKGDVTSSQKIGNELSASGLDISIQHPGTSETRNQIWFVKDGTLSKFKPKKPEVSES